MSSIAAVRNQNSVQVSLTELRQIHTARLEAEKQDALRKRLEAEAQKIEAERLCRLQEEEAENRRLAAEAEREHQRTLAEHELALAKERARIDAEARLQEKRLDVELQRTEFARAQIAGTTRPHRLPLSLLAVLLLALQGALLWQHHHTEARLQRAMLTVSELEEQNHAAERALDNLTASLQNIETTAERAESRTTDMTARLQALESLRPVPARARSSSTTRPRAPKPQQKPAQNPIDVSKCAGTPLGCLE